MTEVIFVKCILHQTEEQFVHVYFIVTNEYICLKSIYNLSNLLCRHLIKCSKVKAVIVKACCFKVAVGSSKTIQTCIKLQCTTLDNNLIPTCVSLSKHTKVAFIVAGYFSNVACYCISECKQICFQCYLILWNSCYIIACCIVSCIVPIICSIISLNIC